MNEYETSDLYESAYITACGVKLIRLDGEKDQQIFVFSNKKICEKLSKAYWFNGAAVPAKHYADSIRSLKDLLFSKLRENQWKEKN